MIRDDIEKFADIIWLHENERRDAIRTLQKFYEANAHTSATKYALHELTRYAEEHPALRM